MIMRKLFSRSNSAAFKPAEMDDFFLTNNRSSTSDDLNLSIIADPINPDAPVKAVFIIKLKVIKI